MNDRPKNKPFPPGIYTLSIAFVVMMSAAFLYHGTGAGGGGTDSRSVEEMCEHVLNYEKGKHLWRESKDSPTASWTPVSDEAIERCVKNTTEQMQLMEFMATSEPQPPTAPEKPECSLVKCPLKWKDYHDKEDVYEQLKRIYPDRLKLWKLNQETRSEYVLVPGLVPQGPSSPEERSHGAGKFLYMGNLDSFVFNAKHQAAISWLKQVSSRAAVCPIIKTDAWPQLKWLRQGAPEGDEGLNEHIVKVYLGKPLKCPRWVSGQCIRTLDGLTPQQIKDFMDAYGRKDHATMQSIMQDGDECRLVAPLAEDVTKSNHRLHAEKQWEIYPYICFRNVLHQSVLWSSTNKGAHLPERPSQTTRILRKVGLSERIPMNGPGLSNHQQGLAMDVINMGVAKPYLALEAGMMCDYIDNDNAHCAVGEIQLTSGNIARKCREDMAGSGIEIPAWLQRL